MSTNFAYKAPQYVDFETNPFEHEDKEKIEAYFDYDHENPDSFLIDESQCSLLDGAEQFYSPSARDDDDFNRPNGLRKSLSMSCLPQDPKPQNEENNLCIAMNKTSLYSSNRSINKTCHGKGSSTSLDQKSYYSSKELLTHGNNKKYVSMAEAITNFHKRTPVRFHSKPKSSQPTLVKSNGPIPSTIPQSPAFATKKRYRPVTVISQEQKELQEFEEAQKQKIKANPVNMKILQGPFKPKVPLVKKPSTIFAPFNITEVQKAKQASPKKDVYEFHAKPVPKSVYEPKKPLRKPIQCTQALTPNFVKKYSEKMKQAQANLQKEKEKEKEPETKNHKLSNTRPVPFSFEKRDQILCKKKEEFLKKVIEEEKKMHEFHARPLPKKIFRSPQPKTNRSSTLMRGSLESLRSTKSDDDNSTAGTVFKARPAKVLSMEPFVPKKEERPLIEITEFHLNTNRRAKERDDFEKKLREKQQFLEEARKEREEEDKLRMEEEIARLRKQAEHVAKPIRHYKEVPRITPKPLTQPCTPKLATSRLRNKENMNTSDFDF